MRYYRRLHIGMYYENLKVWRKYFPWSQIKIVDGKAFKKNPVPILNDIEDFLNVPNYIKQDFFKRGTKGFFCLKKKNGCMDSSKGRTHPKVSDTTIKVLQEFYHPQNIMFFKYINKSMSWE